MRAFGRVAREQRCPRRQERQRTARACAAAFHPAEHILGRDRLRRERLLGSPGERQMERGGLMSERMGGLEVRPNRLARRGREMVVRELEQRAWRDQRTREVRRPLPTRA